MLDVMDFYILSRYISMRFKGIPLTPASFSVALTVETKLLTISFCKGLCRLPIVCFSISKFEFVYCLRRKVR